MGNLDPLKSGAFMRNLAFSCANETCKEESMLGVRAESMLCETRNMLCASARYVDACARIILYMRKQEATRNQAVDKRKRCLWNF